MRERLTARVLLLDPDDRILLIKGRLVNNPTSFWFTVGGGAEPGESVFEAAVREVREEAGFDAIELGPVVWRRDAENMMADGALALLKESYIVARCPGGEPNRDGWDAVERELCDDIRWWTYDEIAASADMIYPEGLADLLPDILAGRYPAVALDITCGR